MAAIADLAVKKYQFTEEFLSESARQVDRDAGVIRGVRILGKVSKNGREYSDKALSDAAKLYEGTKVNIDHPSRSTAGGGGATAERPYAVGFGELRGVKVDGTGDAAGVTGDLHYNRKHPLAEQVCEDAERFPRQFGLSHNAEGAMRHVNGKWIVESLESVRSVDLVGRPATNAGLFESVDETGKGSTVEKKSLRQLVESAGKPELKTRLVKLLEEEPGMAAMADAPAEMPAAGSSEDGIKAAFRSAVMAAFDDDKLDTKATLKKIGDILKAYDKLQGGGESKADTPAAGGESSPAMESLREEIATMKRQAAAVECARLLESAGHEAKPEIVTALLPLDAAARKVLVESLGGGRPAIFRPGAAKPAVVPLRESTGGGAVTIPKFETPADRAAFLRRG